MLPSHESQHALIFLLEHDLRANAFSRFSRGKTSFHFFGSCSQGETPFRQRLAPILPPAARIAFCAPALARAFLGPGSPGAGATPRRRSTGKRLKISSIIKQLQGSLIRRTARRGLPGNLDAKVLPDACLPFAPANMLAFMPIFHPAGALFPISVAQLTL